MSTNKNRMFSEVPESEVVEVWYASKSKTEVLKRLNFTNFGSKNARLKEIIQKWKLPPFQLKKVEDLTTLEIKGALQNPNITTLKSLCIELGIAKKIHKPLIHVVDEGIKR